jgi:hypothetical protein
MTRRNQLAIAALAATLALGCGADRAPWGGPGPGDAVAEARGGDVRPDGTDLVGDVPGDASDAADLAPALVDAAPELSDAAPDLPPELTETLDAAPELADLEDAELCAPDCEGKECGPDGCGGSCGACPESAPFCNMAFQCEACEPVCAEKECGPDGCGGSCGACPTGWACAAGDCQPPQCTGELTLFEEGFQLCNEGAIVVEDDQPDDPVTWLVLEEETLSGACAIHLGDPVGGTYDTGDPVSARLLLPVIEVPADGNPFLVRFALRMDAEPVVAPEYPYDHDVLTLRAYGDGLPAAGVALFDSKQFLNNTGGAWVLAAASLDGYAGLSLQLRFEFDTIDSVDNAYTGIWLDDIRVGTACPLCFTADDCVDAEPCLEDLCVPFSNLDGEDFGACGHLPKDFCCVGLDPSWCDDFDPCTEDACDPVSGDCTHLTIEECGA